MIPRNAWNIRGQSAGYSSCECNNREKNSWNYLEEHIVSANSGEISVLIEAF